MRKIKPSNENEMIYEFLKMEFDSDRFRNDITAVLEKLHIDSTIVTNGNINSEYENVLRAEILKHFRGWRDEKMFDKFPIKIDWVWTVFDREDISKIIYIQYSYWNELSNYTGSPLEAAKTILSGKMIYDIPNDDFIAGSQRIKEGRTFPPLIFLTDESEQRFIVLEGHARMTSYGLVPELFQNVSVILGYCDYEELNQWYGKMPERPIRML